VKNSIKVGVVFLSLVILSSAFAGPVTGVWHGHIKFVMQNLPTPPTAQTKAGIAKTEQMVVDLTLKADHKFSLAMGGAKPGQPGQTGTWTQNGNTISIQAVSNGKNMGAAQTFTLSKDQKSFALSQKNPQTKKEMAVITFSR
jgi:hypothetical protein